MAGRTEPLTHEDLVRLCNELKRAIALLGSDEGESLGMGDLEADL